MYPSRSKDLKQFPSLDGKQINPPGDQNQPAHEYQIKYSQSLEALQSRIRDSNEDMSDIYSLQVSVPVGSLPTSSWTLSTRAPDLDLAPSWSSGRWFAILDRREPPRLLGGRERLTTEEWSCRARVIAKEAEWRDGIYLSETASLVFMILRGLAEARSRNSKWFSIFGQIT